jgi:hypothetical protein
MKLFLIFVNYIGVDYKGNYIYEFIFSTTNEGIDGDEWDTYPASGRPRPPHESFIAKVGRLESELRLDTVQHSDTFAVWDAVDGVIALAWENVDDYDSYPDKRICFKFGETLKEVEETLYEKDLILKYNENEYKE